MAIKVEHELHERRKGRNYGLLVILIAFVAIVFGLTVVKVLQLGDANKFAAFDHVVRPEIEPIATQSEGASE
ncbi:MAG: hypothetical protein EBT13_03120 [Rhodobacteraceae bacterium]|jgi:Na+/H+-dicarboxylate symporter|nr:hypothetical protein [Paracoccaceae bacterium]